MRCSSRPARRARFRAYQKARKYRSAQNRSRSSLRGRPRGRRRQGAVPPAPDGGQRPRRGRGTRSAPVAAGPLSSVPVATRRGRTRHRGQSVRPPPSRSGRVRGAATGMPSTKHPSSSSRRHPRGPTGSGRPRRPCHKPRQRDGHLSRTRLRRAVRGVAGVASPRCPAHRIGVPCGRSGRPAHSSPRRECWQESRTATTKGSRRPLRRAVRVERGIQRPAVRLDQREHITLELLVEPLGRHLVGEPPAGSSGARWSFRRE